MAGVEAPNKHLQPAPFASVPEFRHNRFSICFHIDVSSYSFAIGVLAVTLCSSEISRGWWVEVDPGLTRKQNNGSFGFWGSAKVWETFLCPLRASRKTQD